MTALAHRQPTSRQLTFGSGAGDGRFHPAVAEWFRRRFPEGPTPPQAEGWVHIAAGADTLIAAPDRESLINVTRALDRVLLWSHFVVPNWHNPKAFVAYWNRFARPAKAAKYSPVAFYTWWIDEAKDKALQSGERK